MSQITALHKGRQGHGSHKVRPASLRELVVFDEGTPTSSQAGPPLT
jgi:hypothetical protein